MAGTDPKSKVVVVTGGSSGSGKAAARIFLKNGFSVVIAGRDEARLHEAQEELCRLGPAFAVAADVADKDQADRMIAAAVAQFGRVDVLVNCAGIFGPFIHFLDLTRKDWDDELEVHLFGVIYPCQAAARQMRKQNEGGAIVTISSINAWQVEQRFTPHCVAKGAIPSLTRGMACDLAEFGIRVNGVAPGWVNSPMATADFAGIEGEPIDCNIIRRPAEPSEIAEIIYFLASPASSCLAGETILADGGQMALLTGIRTVDDSEKVNRMRRWQNTPSASR